MSDPFERFQALAVEVLSVDAAQVTKEASFAEDLDADSLDLAELVMALEDEFEGGAFVLNAENGGITYSDFHDADIPDEVAELLEATRAGLADGSIETGIDPISGLPL